MRAIFLLGRAIFGGFFLQNGLRHFQHRQTMSGYAASKGVPNPDAAVVASGALMVAGGLSVLSGWKPRPGLAAIVGFLVPVSLIMHRFWEIEDEQQRMNETIQFMKNMALVGGTLMLMQVPEPWPASIDGFRSEDDDMYLRLDTRERLRLMA